MPISQFPLIRATLCSQCFTISTTCSQRPSQFPPCALRDHHNFHPVLSETITISTPCSQRPSQFPPCALRDLHKPPQLNPIPSQTSDLNKPLALYTTSRFSPRDLKTNLANSTLCSQRQTIQSLVCAKFGGIMFAWV